jgi:uncharacterized protein YjbI with pentapeptide repeats
MSGIKPKNIKIRNRILDVCTHGECEANRIWDYQTCWMHMTELERQSLKDRLSTTLRTSKDLSKIVLSYADLANFDFTGVNLSEAFLHGCDLSNCSFVEANLYRTFLGNANLTNADLTRAELDHAVFSGANLTGVILLAYSLSFGRIPINLYKRSFGKEGLFQRPHINEDEPGPTEATYRALKAHFISVGEYDSASWASYCERLMQRKYQWEKKNYLGWSTLLLFGAISGYGEKPIRPIISSVFIVGGYAVIYKVFNLVALSGANSPINWLDALTFSFATFCTYSFQDLTTKAAEVARITVATEAFTGIFALGLFVFTLTKRYVAR